MKRTLTALAAAAALTAGLAAPAPATPDGVTHAEFKHATHGMTRTEVRHLYGVRGHAFAGYWGSDGRFYLYVRYPRARGGFTEVTFVDRSPSSSDYHLFDKSWVA